MNIRGRAPKYGDDPYVALWNASGSVLYFSPRAAQHADIRPDDRVDVVKHEEGHYVIIHPGVTGKGSEIRRFQHVHGSRSCCGTKAERIGVLPGDYKLGPPESIDGLTAFKLNSVK